MQEIVDWYYSDSKFLAISAPTGTGKSLLSLAAQRALKVRVHTLVSTLRLQDQMRESYKYAPVLKGRNNYECLITDEKVGNAPCQVGFRCDLKNSCDYFIERDSAYTSQYAVFNYSLYMHLLEHEPQTFIKPELLVCDEAHLIHANLENYISAQISLKDIAREGWRRPGRPTVEGLADWATANLPSVLKEFKTARGYVYSVLGKAGGDSIKGNSRDYRRAMARYKRYEGLARTLNLFIQAGVDTGNGRPWVYDKSGPFYGVRPVFVDQHNKYLFDEDVPKFVLMSATINEDDIERLGIEDYKFVSTGSNYAPKYRPIFYRPVGPMSARNEAKLMPDVVYEMDAVIDHQRKQGSKGIIHSVSYQRSKDIVRLSRNSDIMLTHTKENKDEIVKQFKNSKTPVVLVSPSILEGEDFPGEQCRYILMPKVPYLSLGDAVVQERMEYDPNWYTWKAVQDIIQGAGRGTRSSTDFSAIYVFDSMFEQVVRQHQAEIPEWFKEAVHYFDWE